jgi:uncharacterized protein YyaL (SSP411 family)
MVWALARGARHFAEAKYLQAAQKAMSFMRENLMSGGKLQRFWREGAAVGAATAEDYASLIQACIELHQADLDSRWASWAVELQQTLDQDFWDEDSGLYFANDGRDPRLPLRPKDEYDGVTPSSNSQSALNLWRLYLLTGDSALKTRAERIARSLDSRLKRYPSGLAFFALALDERISDTAVVVVNGEGWPLQIKRDLERSFLPHTLWTRAESAWPVSQGKASATPTVFICHEGHCLAPMHDAREAETQIRPR